MTALDRLVEQALGLPLRLAWRRNAVPVLAVGLVVAIGAVALLSPPWSRQDGGQGSGASGASGPVDVGAAAQPTMGVPPRLQADLSAIRSELAARPKPTAPSEPNFWELLYAFEGTGPAYRSLTDLGKTSEAVVMGSFTGAVEPGRVPCDQQQLADGDPPEQACVFFANLPFRIDEVLAGSLPDQYRASVKLEYMVRPSRQALLPEAAPTDEQIVLFIGSKGLRDHGIQDVYYEVGVGKGTFRNVDGRVVPLALPDDQEVGRLDGMPFERFIELVRRVPILDLMPEG